MADYGVTSTGFVLKEYGDIVDDVGERQKAAFGASFNTSEDSTAGISNGIIGDKLAELWEVLQAVYSAAYPDSASNASLDYVSEITGTIRKAATSSTVDIICTGTPTTSLAAGRQVTTGAGDLFASDAIATIAASTAWAASTAYVVGDIRYNGTKVYICVTAGTSDGSGGPTGTGDSIADNTAVWDYVGDGTGYVSVAFTATLTGVVPIPADTVHVGFGTGSISTPVSGWDGARNIVDGGAGTNTESDPDLRLRRSTELSAAGRGTIDAIQANISSVDLVAEVKILENTTNSVDADGLPGKSFEALVSGGLDQDVADAVWEAKGGGIESFGSSSGTANDDNGSPHTVYFTRPTTLNIYIDITVTKNTDASEGAVYPADGDAQIQAAIVAAGGTFGVGDDVIAQRLRSAAFGVSGVTDVPIFELDTVASPSATSNIVVGVREQSDFDTSRIVVT